ncbi:lysozyme [Sodiomyces alkalinus F11]|uniref:Lysozyme n=1 Tax=Sodiomyces alkalinus (strain CBS 110278 / VKM F-3762 / F11) TaxID=1314773 RepID=A0A3N2PPP5_SODAK|nr:lysozyme [Sodiomyces alkalinus F11]ROT36481.1 lysozyme [Sodiomyces alkalinus F11]
MVSFTKLALLALGAVQAQAQCVGPSINTAALNLIKEFEGWRPNIYLDPVGLPTVGYGHLCRDSRCSDVPYPIPLSVANGERLLRSDLITYQNCITRQTASSVVLNANQYGALVSWAFNVGCTATSTSTLIRRLNAGEAPNTVAAQELPRWNMAGGQVLPGLTRRRAAEVDLHRTATSVRALPACS